MRFLRSLVDRLAKRAATSTTTANTTTRRFAQVHDIKFEVAHEKPGMALNVFKKPLALHSTSPMTGFLRNGYCEAPKSDFGNHSVAGIVTDEFLDYSAKQGNDLRQAGLTDGCKWCLCVSRWREAFENRTSDDDRKVPRIVLQATNQRALEGVKMEDLKKFAVDNE